MRDMQRVRTIAQGVCDVWNEGELLGGKWLYIPSEYSVTLVQEDYTVTPKGKDPNPGICLSYNNAERLDITGEWPFFLRDLNQPRDKQRVEKVQPYKEDKQAAKYRQITVDPLRPPHKIAEDIKKRFLPGYCALYQALKMRAEKNQEKELQGFKVWQQFMEVPGAEARVNHSHYDRKYRLVIPGATVEIHYDAAQVDFLNVRTDVETGLELARLLAQKCGE